MPQPTWIGQTIGGRYRIEALLGQGGMSAVYKGVDPNLRRTVAIKLIHPHLASDPEFVRRFEEEAAAVAALRHPNIIQVYDFNHDDDTYYMVLEFVEGETLAARLQHLRTANRRLPLDKALTLMATVSEAVHNAHERGLIHRDLKPANVMIDASGRPVLMDFGLAKIVGGSKQTATGAIMGTPAYISPEQVRGEKPDRRTDIYALGIMLFEMACGQVPFDADSALTLMLKHVNEPPPDIRTLNPGLSEGVAQLIEKAIAKNPAERFQTAHELADSLREAATTRAVPASTVVSAPPPPLPVTPVSATVRLETSAPPPAVQSKWVWGGLIGLVLLVGTGLGLALLNGLAPASPGVTPSLPAVAALTPVTTTPTRPLPTLTVAPPSATLAASATTAPSATPPPASETPSPSAPPPSATPPPSPTALAARITAMSVSNGRYMVDFTTVNYVAALPGYHIHLFFDTVPPNQAGVPGAGPWYVHGAGSPVSPYAVSERPANATRMCILVALPNHTIIPESGNCVALP